MLASSLLCVLIAWLFAFGQPSIGSRLDTDKLALELQKGNFSLSGIDIRIGGEYLDPATILINYHYKPSSGRSLESTFFWRMELPELRHRSAFFIFDWKNGCNRAMLQDMMQISGQNTSHRYKSYRVFDCFSCAGSHVSLQYRMETLPTPVDLGRKSMTKLCAPPSTHAVLRSTPAQPVKSPCKEFKTGLKALCHRLQDHFWKKQNLCEGDIERSFQKGYFESGTRHTEIGRSIIQEMGYVEKALFDGLHNWPVFWTGFSWSLGTRQLMDEFIESSCSHGDHCRDVEHPSTPLGKLLRELDFDKPGSLFRQCHDSGEDTQFWAAVSKTIAEVSGHGEWMAELQERQEQDDEYGADEEYDEYGFRHEPPDF